eukprot:2036413-Pyramimonas_sp.AAC.1
MRSSPLPSKISANEASDEPASTPMTLQGTPNIAEAMRKSRNGAPHAANPKLFAIVGIGAKRTRQIILKGSVLMARVVALNIGNRGSTRSSTTRASNVRPRTNATAPDVIFAAAASAMAVASPSRCA